MAINKINFGWPKQNKTKQNKRTHWSLAGAHRSSEKTWVPDMDAEQSGKISNYSSGCTTVNGPCWYIHHLNQYLHKCYNSHRDARDQIPKYQTTSDTPTETNTPDHKFSVLLSPLAHFWIKGTYKYPMTLLQGRPGKQVFPLQAEEAWSMNGGSLSTRLLKDAGHH